jgi:hypothetical protein
MKRAILGAIGAGMAMLMVGCGTVPLSPDEERYADRMEQECRELGYIPDRNQFNGKWKRCIEVNWAESEAQKLECIRAGGMPYTDLVRATGKDYRIYKTCGAKQMIVQQRSERPQYKSSVPDLPVSFEPRDRGQTCQTNCNSYGSCTTTCSPR